MIKDSTLKQLFMIIPFSEKERENFLAQLSNLSEEGKLAFFLSLWETLSFSYQNRLGQRFENAFGEITERKREYSPQDFRRIEEEVVLELFRKLKETKAKEEIKEIKEELQDFRKGEEKNE